MTSSPRGAQWVTRATKRIGRTYRALKMHYRLSWFARLLPFSSFFSGFLSFGFRSSLRVSLNQNYCGFIRYPRNPPKPSMFLPLFCFNSFFLHSTTANFCGVVNISRRGFLCWNLFSFWFISINQGCCQVGFQKKLKID